MTMVFLFSQRLPISVDSWSFLDWIIHLGRVERFLNHCLAFQPIVVLGDFFVISHRYGCSAWMILLHHLAAFWQCVPFHTRCECRHFRRGDGDLSSGLGDSGQHFDLHNSHVTLLIFGDWPVLGAIKAGGANDATANFKTIVDPPIVAHYWLRILIGVLKALSSTYADVTGCNGRAILIETFFLHI